MDHLGLNLVHMASAVWGIGLRFDPAIFPPDLRACWGAVVFWAGLTVYGVSNPSAGLLEALIVFWTSPMWAGVIGGLSDPIMEYRAYSAVLGWALILVAIAPSWAVWLLVAVWAVQSFFRSRHLQSAFCFWGRVLVENRGQGARAQAAYARAAFDEGMFDRDE